MHIKKILCGIVILGMLAQPVVAAKPGSEDERYLERYVNKLYDLTEADRILSRDEGKLLEQLLEVVFNRYTRSVPLLKSTALSITDKAVKDRGNLQFLLGDLEKLAQEKYSSKIGRIKPKNLNSCFERMDRLIAGMQKGRPEFNQPQKKLDASDYIKIINANSVFLTGTGEAESAVGVWTSIQNATEKAYLRWEKKYQKLLKKINEQKGKDAEELLSDEELKFIKTFGRVNIFYAILSG